MKTEFQLKDKVYDKTPDKGPIINIGIDRYLYMVCKYFIESGGNSYPGKELPDVKIHLHNYRLGDGRPEYNFEIIINDESVRFL